MKLSWTEQLALWSSKRGFPPPKPLKGYKEPLILLKVDPAWLKDLGCTRYGHAISPKRVKDFRLTTPKQDVVDPPPFDPPYTVSLTSMHEACTVVELG